MIYDEMHKDIIASQSKDNESTNHRQSEASGLNHQPPNSK